MPRDSSGNYSLPPAYNPVLTGTTITSAWANTTMSDIATALTDSLSRSGRGGLTAPFLLIDGTAGAPGLAFAGELSTGLYRNGASQPTFVVSGVPIWSANASKQFLVEASGGTILSSPTSGYTLTVNGPLGVTVPGPAATQLSALNFTQSGQQGWVIYQPASSDDFRIYNSNSTDVIILHKTGNVTIPTPQSGATALTVNGVAGNSAVTIVAPNTAGQSFGLLVNAGTNASDYVASFANVTPTTIQYIQSDGQNFTYFPTAFTDKSGSTLYQIGFLEIVQNYQPNSYTLVMSDRGKNVFHDTTTAQTYTIPANASVAYPVGTTITITNVQGASGLTIACGDTLRWVPNNLTGSRTLAGAGLCTITKMRTTEWWLTGVGVS